MYRYNAMLIYLIVINIVAFLIYGADKRRAKQNVWRISEKTLLFFALIGGSLGAFFGMRIFRHKTKKALFSIGVPCILLAHVAVVAWCITK